MDGKVIADLIYIFVWVIKAASGNARTRRRILFKGYITQRCSRVLKMLRLTKRVYRHRILMYN